MKNSNFDKRMKDYENNNKLFLMKKTPVIIRIDGRAFHTFTKGLNKPFDEILNYCMCKTSEKLLNSISNCIMAYTQSDEISLLLLDTKSIKTDPWFDNNQQKLVSLSASIATLEFNKVWNDCIVELESESKLSSKELDIFKSKSNRALFDSRAFNLPITEVLNYFIWRQRDATRNSVSSLAQSQFSHKELLNKSSSDMQDMLMLNKNINWNNTPTKFKRGVCVYKKTSQVVSQENKTSIRNKSFIDYEMPILNGKSKFIDDLIESYLSN